MAQTLVKISDNYTVEQPEWLLYSDWYAYNMAVLANLSISEIRALRVLSLMVENEAVGSQVNYFGDQARMINDATRYYRSPTKAMMDDRQREVLHMLSNWMIANGQADPHDTGVSAGDVNKMLNSARMIVRLPESMQNVLMLMFRNTIGI